jgi:hypothetical protein
MSVNPVLSSMAWAWFESPYRGTTNVEPWGGSYQVHAGGWSDPGFAETVGEMQPRKGRSCG